MKTSVIFNDSEIWKGLMHNTPRVGEIVFVEYYGYTVEEVQWSPQEQEVDVFVKKAYI